jgi:hypothetical protein
MTLKRVKSKPRTAIPADQTRPPRTESFIRISVELNCLMCGRELGVLECGAWPEFGAAILHRPCFPNVIVLNWRGLRCSVCAGAVVPSEIVSRRARKEGPIDWGSDKPRRGRPPKHRQDTAC